jgi:transposase
VVGEIRALEAADRGEQKLFLKHMRDTFFVHGDVWRTMAETQASVQKLVSAADGARVVAMLAVTVSKSSWLRVAYGAFLATTKHYVPFATPQEFALQSRLSAEERRFVRILHFMPGTENTEDLLLTDTGKPVTMVIVGATSNERMETARIAKIDDMKRTGGAVWEWNAILGGIPTLPALSRPHLERSAVG